MLFRPDGDTLGPLKMELERALRELNVQSRLAQGMLSEALLLEATGPYSIPGEMLDFVNQLPEQQAKFWTAMRCQQYSR